MSDLHSQVKSSSVSGQLMALSVLGIGVFSGSAIASEPSPDITLAVSDAPGLAEQHASLSVSHHVTGAPERLRKTALPVLAYSAPNPSAITPDSQIMSVVADGDAPTGGTFSVPVGTLPSMHQAVGLADLSIEPPGVGTNFVADSSSVASYRQVAGVAGLSSQGGFEQRATGLAGIEQLKPIVSPMTDEDLPAPGSSTSTPDMVSLNGDVDGFGDESPWRFEIRPFVELPFRVNGDFGFDTELGFNGDDSDDGDDGGDGDDGSDNGGTNLSFDSGFELEDLFALGGEAEIWYNNFGVALGGYYVDLGSQVLVGASTDNRAITSSVRLSTSYVRAQASLAWRIGRFSLASQPADSQPQDEIFPAVNVDLMGGAEYINFDIEADFNNLPDLTLGPDWLAPAVRLRAEWLFNSRTKLVTAGEIGGFGVGNSPDLLYKISVALDWRIFPNFSIRPAYRLTDYNWQREGRFADSELDLQTQGVFLGLSYIFE